MQITVIWENGEIFQHFGHTAQFKVHVAIGSVNGLNRGKPQILRKLLHGNPLIYANCPEVLPGGGQVNDRIRGKSHRVTPPSGSGARRETENSSSMCPQGFWAMDTNAFAREIGNRALS